MRKVIKIFLGIAAAIAALPIAAGVALFIPGVQRIVVGAATAVVSRKLDTEVSIGAIRITPFDRIAIHDFYVGDYRGDTLLSAGRIDVGIVGLGLRGGTPTLGSVELDGVRFYLDHDSTGRSNLRRVTEKMRRKRERDTTKIFRLDARSVEINDLRFRNRKNPVPREGVNVNDTEVKDFHLLCRDVSIVKDSVSLTIDDISFRERSGFAIDALSCRDFDISGEGIIFHGLDIAMPESRLDMDSLKILTGTWQGYKNFIEDVRFEAAMRRSTVSFATISYFAPSLRRFNTVFEDATCSVWGPIADLHGQFHNVSVGAETSLEASFAIRGIPDMKNAMFDIDVTEMRSSGRAALAIAEDFSGGAIPGMDAYTDELGTVTLRGWFKGSFGKFASFVDTDTDMGEIDLSIDADIAGANKSFGGRMDISDIDLGGIASTDRLGFADLDADFSGSYREGTFEIETDTHIDYLNFNEYGYRDIDIDGQLRGKRFSGDIVSRDTSAVFDFAGILDFTDSIPDYDFTLSLHRADLNTLGFNRRDSISLLSCRIDAVGSGADIENIDGRIDISDLHYINHLDSVSLGTITVTGDNDERHKYVAVRSDVADMEFRSRMSYRTLVDYIRRTLDNYLPTLTPYSATGTALTTTGGNDDTADNYSILKFDVKEANNLTGIFLPGLKLASGTSLSMMVNPYANILNFSATSDYIEREDFFASEININGRNNDADSLMFYFSVRDIYSGNMYVPGVNIVGGAKDSAVKLSAGYNYPDKDNSALITVNATLERDSLTDIPQVRIRFEPSSFRSGQQGWRIMSHDIIYDTTRVSIDDFRIVGSGQQLRVRGVLSMNEADSLNIRLDDFALGSLADFIRIKGYDIDGNANGTATVTSRAGNRIMTADMDLYQLKINDIEAPPVVFRSLWDFKRGGAGFEIARKENDEKVIRGLYRPSLKRLEADLTFSDLDVSLLDPVLEGVMSDIRGEAATDIRLSLEGRRLELDGSIDVASMATTVDFLNVRYRLADTTRIDITNNVFTVENARLLDPNGNGAPMKMRLDLGSLTNIRYDVDISPSKMLVLNTTSENNNMFYGTVYASGHATIRGDRRNIDMDISASTDDNSRFYLPLSDKAEASKADFIVFASDRPGSIDTTDVSTRRRMIFEQRRRQRQRSGKADMDIEMNLNVRPNATFQMIIDPDAGDMIRGTGTGNLRLNIQPGNNIFSMYGDYEIQEGIYHLKLRNLLDRKFVIDPGSTIRWTGDPIDATLDINAVYKLKASLYPLTNDPSMRRKVPVECDIRLTDRLSEPTVVFDVNVPNAAPETQSMIDYALNTEETRAKQFLWLATTGSFAANENGGFNISGNSGSIGYDMLLNQLSNMISTDKFTIGVHYTPAGEFNSDEVSIDLQTNVFSDRLMLEFEGSYDTRNNPTTTNNPNNLTGNFSATWLMDPSGNLMTKGFTRTIDRFDETQGQQESGIGIYYKEDFDKFRDIIVNLRKRFSKKWREYYRNHQETDNKHSSKTTRKQRRTNKTD